MPTKKKTPLFLQLKKHFLLIYWLPAAFWMALIFYLSSQSGQPRFPWLATVGHIVEYTILSALYLFALTRSQAAQISSNPKKVAGKKLQLKIRLATMAFLLSTFYGLTDEVHQYFVPGRFADPMDLLVDSLAALAVSRIFVFFNKEKSALHFKQ